MNNIQLSDTKIIIPEKKFKMGSITYELKNLSIEFVKHFKKEYNEFLINSFYRYYPLYDKGLNGRYIEVEFMRQDPIGYMKIKNKELWLHMDKNMNPFFDVIKKQDFYYRQPLVCWFDYVRDNAFIIFTHVGFGINEVLYMRYIEDKDGIQINWVDKVEDCTNFIFEKIQWKELSWTKLEKKPTL